MKKRPLIPKTKSREIVLLILVMSFVILWTREATLVEGELKKA